VLRHLLMQRCCMGQQHWPIHNMQDPLGAQSGGQQVLLLHQERSVSAATMCMCSRTAALGAVLRAGSHPPCALLSSTVGLNLETVADGMRSEVTTAQLQHVHAALQSIAPISSNSKAGTAPAVHMVQQSVALSMGCCCCSSYVDGCMAGLLPVLFCQGV
jgi:hypothetical protein